MALQWILRPQDHEQVRQLCEATGLSPVVAQILAMRGVTRPAEVEAFFDLRMTRLHPPAALPGMADAVATLRTAIADGQKILVYGDYDCDGMTAAAILFRALKLLGADVSTFIPSRVDDGYGLNADQIRRHAARGVKLLVSVDCGVASVEEVRLANDLGLTVVVTDHHQVGESLPPAAAIVHPGLPRSDYPFPHLCGAGVAFKLAWALFQAEAGSERLPEPMKNALFFSLALAAIGTVADVVPLTGENRVIVHHGLKLMRAFGGIGLNRLLDISKISERREPSSEDIAFSVAPRLNAAGRLGSAQLGTELLVCERPERAAELVEYIDNLNRSRGSLERSIMIEARKQVEAECDIERDAAIVVAGQGWNQGVIGIVAGRLAEKYHRPAIVFSLDPVSDGPVTGSARSALGVNLVEALQQCRERLVKFGGHPLAAGLTILSSQIDPFREEFNEAVAGLLGAQSRTARLEIDAEALFCQLTVDTVRQLEQLAPFGAGNPRPVLFASGLQLVGEPKTMGSDGRHLALNIRQDTTQLRCVAFGKADWSADLAGSPGQGIELAFKPVINDFTGIQRVELQLIDWRAARMEQAASA